MSDVHDSVLNLNPVILGRRLANARKASGFTQENVAKDLEISRATLFNIEQGIRLPKNSELHQLATKYDVTVGELIRQEPPPEPLLIQFRAAPRIDARLDREVERQVGVLQRLCDDYFELERLCGRPLPPVHASTYNIESMPVVRAGEEIAQSERNRLGLGDQPVYNLIELIERQGIALFQLPFPSHVSGLYAAVIQMGLSDDSSEAYFTRERPCMAINVKHPADRRRWTVAHEYAHFLVSRHTREVIVDFLQPNNHEAERFADAFASSFLMPASSVSRRYRELRQDRGGAFLPADLCIIADSFLVSTEAMAVRLEQLDLIKPGIYQLMLNDGFSPVEAQHLLGIQPHQMDTRMIPIRYQYLASEAYHNMRISEDAYADFLREDLLTLRQHHEVIRSEFAEDETGVVKRIKSPFDADMGA